MATIAENLQTLNEAKANIKMAIEAKGQDLTDVPFTQYAEKINLIPTGSESGSVTIKALIDYTKSIAHMFRANSRITDLTGYLNHDDTSNAEDSQSMFYNCQKLLSIPLFDTKKIITIGYMFYGCTQLKVIPAFDFRAVKSSGNAFVNCNSVEEVWIKNIKGSMQFGSGTSYGHLLTVESLIHLIKELRDTGSTLTLTVGSANLEKLANVYVKPIDITDEMRAEDDLIDEKLPFVVCDSADEGACPIVDYASLKNWEVV